MTSKTITLTQEEGKLERFPDFPPREDMQNTSHLHLRSIMTSLLIHYAQPERTLVHGEVPVAPTLDTWEDYRIPDLIVAFDCDVGAVYDLGGYAIDRQGKPPDFELEVASRTTGVRDYTVKRGDYERYGIPEYWRFDPSGGEYHDEALAGDSLADGKYRRIEMEWLDKGRCRGYSEALGLYVCWEEGTLRFYDPVSESYLTTHEEEQAGRLEAEARVAELEAELRRLRGE